MVQFIFSLMFVFPGQAADLNSACQNFEAAYRNVEIRASSVSTGNTGGAAIREWLIHASRELFLNEAKTRCPQMTAENALQTTQEIQATCATSCNDVFLEDRAAGNTALINSIKGNVRPRFLGSRMASTSQLACNDACRTHANAFQSFSVGFISAQSDCAASSETEIQTSEN